jgi:hypothetical protein
MVWVECLISCRGYCQHGPQCPTSCPSCPHRHDACALLFFSPSMPRSSLSVTVFTLCESISTATTVSLYNVQHGVYQFALALLPIPHSRIQWFYFLPLCVCQVRLVQLVFCSYFFHAAIIPHSSYEDKL